MSESGRFPMPEKVDSRRWKEKFKPLLVARIRAGTETLAVLGPGWRGDPSLCYTEGTHTERGTP